MEAAFKMFIMGMYNPLKIQYYFKKDNSFGDK